MVIEFIKTRYCELFPGNTDEYTVFKETFAHYFSLGYGKSLVILADAVPYSIEILRWLFDMGIISLINSKKTIKNQRIKKLTDHFYVNLDFIPAAWAKEQLVLLMNIRSEIGHQFSHITVVYHARRANVRGLEMVSKHRYMIIILDLLKINTSYKIGRPDLIGKTYIFTMTKGVNFQSIFPPIAREEGFLVF